MTREDLLDQQIENYVHDRMSAEERATFEESLKADEKLKNDVFDLLALKSLYNKELFELKQKLDAAEKNLEQEKYFKEEGES
jgi:anti-sigma factor RsiW